MELDDIARAVIAGNLYMALATADEGGMPWVSPVFYTPRGYSDFYWVSSPESRHSRNIAARPGVSIAIYDSRSEIGQAEAVYMRASAAEVPDDELQQRAAIYSSRMPGLREFVEDDLRDPAPIRLYRAQVIEHSVLVRGADPRNERGADDRIVVELCGLCERASRRHRRGLPSITTAVPIRSHA